MDGNAAFWAFLNSLAVLVLFIFQRYESWRVAKELAKQTKVNDHKLDSIDVLVNSRLTEANQRATDALASVATLAKRIAAITHAPADVAAAGLAQATLDLHMKESK